MVALMQTWTAPRAATTKATTARGANRGLMTNTNVREMNWKEKTMVAKERHCPYCGESMGVLNYVNQYDTCGELECERWALGQAAADREDAHEQLDRDLGY